MKFTMPLKILLADRDYCFYLDLRKALQSLPGIPCELIWCGECKEMIRAAQATVYDLVLFDYEYCGSRLLQRAERAGVRTPIVALTNGEQQAELQALRDGAFGCIAKPNWDLTMFKHFVLCADLHRNGEIHTSVAMVGAGTGQGVYEAGFESATLLAGGSSAMTH